MSNTYEIVFRGDVVPGQSMTDVKQRVAELFKVDDQRAEQLFSGRPVVLKKNLDEQKAKQYQEVLKSAGAVVQLRAVASEAPSSEALSGDALSGDALSRGTPAEAVNTDVSTADKDESDLSLSPVGADVLAPDERREYTDAEFDLDHLSVGDTGEDVLADEEKKSFVERDVDISHLSIESPDD